MMTINKLLPTLGLLLMSVLGFSQTVSTVGDLQTELDNAVAGTVITIANGTYTNADLGIEANGTVANPIIIQGETPGGVIFENNCRIKMGGAYITLTGVKFTGVYSLPESGASSYAISFKNGSECSNCTVKQVQIDDYNPSSITDDFRWIRVYGQDNEISYSTFNNKDCQGSMIFNQRGNGIEDRMKIHHNYFSNRLINPNGVDGANDYDVMRIGDSGNSLSDSNSEIYDNYFYEVKGGEPEIIANKSGGNKYYNNTFENYLGALSLRHGEGCEVYSNFFLNVSDPNLNFNGGIRVIGPDHKIYNNYIQGTNASKGSSSSKSGSLGGINVSATQDWSTTTDEDLLKGYQKSTGVVIVNNTLVNCDSGFRIGYDSGGANQNIAPEDFIIANNLLVNCNVFLQAEREPANSTYAGNMFEGSGSATAGFSKQSNLLSTSLVDGIYPITANSPAVNASAGDYSVYFMDDVFAGSRSGTFDVGAQEYGATMEKGPYKQADVGVNLGFGAIEPAAGPSLNTNPTSLNYSVDGESLTFNITSNVSWSISDDASWLTFDTNSGTDSATITATATANTTGVERTATITVGRGDLEKTITVTQSDGTFNPETDATEITVDNVLGVGTQSNSTNVAANTIDGVITNRWSGESADGSAYLTFDLGCIHTLTDISISFFKSTDRRTTISIATSIDNSNYANVYTEIESTLLAAEGYEDFDLNLTQAQYIRVYGFGYTEGTASGDWNSIQEVKFYGNEDCETTLGIDSNESLKSKGVTLYPVPVTNGELTISSPKYTVNGVEVYNMAGQQVISAQVNNQNTTQINVTDLTAGVYFLVLEEIGIGKFIVK